VIPQRLHRFYVSGPKGYPKFSRLEKTILEIFQTKHARNRSDLYPIEIEIVERLRITYVPHLDSPEPDGYLVNIKHISSFSGTLSVLAGGAFLQKFVEKIDRK